MTEPPVLPVGKGRQSVQMFVDDEGGEAGTGHEDAENQEDQGLLGLQLPPPKRREIGNKNCKWKQQSFLPAAFYNSVSDLTPDPVSRKLGLPHNLICKLPHQPLPSFPG